MHATIDAHLQQAAVRHSSTFCCTLYYLVQLIKRQSACETLNPQSRKRAYYFGAIHPASKLHKFYRSRVQPAQQPATVRER